MRITLRRLGDVINGQLVLIERQHGRAQYIGTVMNVLPVRNEQEGFTGHYNWRRPDVVFDTQTLTHYNPRVIRVDGNKQEVIIGYWERWSNENVPLHDGDTIYLLQHGVESELEQLQKIPQPINLEDNDLVQRLVAQTIKWSDPNAVRSGAKKI